MQRRVAQRIEGLGAAPRPPGAEMLKAGEGEFRIRVGDWRVIYSVHDDEILILVIKIGHRATSTERPDPGDFPRHAFGIIASPSRYGSDPRR